MIRITRPRVAHDPLVGPWPARGSAWRSTGCSRRIAPASLEGETHERIPVVLLGAALVAPALGTAQSITPTREEVVALTSEWTGERFADGRPKVPDAILERMKNVNLEEAWSALGGKGFEWQFEGRFKLVHLDQTATMVGRALTATFVPKRPDLDKALTDKGHAAGHVGGRNSWPIDLLQKGDVYVANAFGSYEGGPIIGGNLSTAIFRNSGNGVVFDGSVRDIAQMETIEGFKGWVRDWHPSYNYDNMLVEINRPARIGVMLCLPGDVVLAKREGSCASPRSSPSSSARPASRPAPRHVRLPADQGRGLHPGPDRPALERRHGEGLLEVAQRPHRQTAGPA